MGNCKHLIVVGLLAAFAVFKMCALERPLPVVANKGGPEPGGSSPLLNKAAPELQGEKWLNTNKPMTLKASRGKVVLLYLWRFGCPYCQQSAPKVNAWYQQYRDKGLVVIGIHAPDERAPGESDPAQVQQAVKNLGLQFPIVLDNDHKLWNAYQGQVWPTYFLVNKEGKVKASGSSELMERMDDEIGKLVLPLKNAAPERRAQIQTTASVP